MPKLVYNEQILSGGIPKGQVENILRNLASDYNSTSTYAVGDYVIYGGILYKCTTAITTAETFNSAKWETTDCGKEIDKLNSRLNEVFQSVSDGKSLIASAITDKGIITISDATFEEMALNISRIPRGVSYIAMDLETEILPFTLIQE